MLVLSRRVGEAVCVGPGVVIRVLEARGNCVRLAFDAPQEVRVLRAELGAIGLEPVQAATRASMSAAPPCPQNAVSS